MIVGPQYVFFSAKGTDQHQQSRLRQMEVGEHGANYFEIETGIDEQVCLSCAGEERSAAEANGVFEGSDCSGAYGDDAAGITHSPIDRRSGAIGDRVELGVKFVIFDTVYVNRLKGAQADVERDFHGLDAAVPDSAENF